MKNVLLVGESWVSAATHYKGFDQFGSVTFHLGAEPLVKALEGSDFALTYMPAHEAAEGFPFEMDGLASIRRDHPLRHRLQHPAAAARRLAAVADRAEPPEADPRLGGERRRPADVRRLLQLPGHRRPRPLAPHRRRGRAAGRPACPTTTGSRCPRAASPTSSSPSHPVLAGMGDGWPPLLGVNEVDREARRRSPRPPARRPGRPSRCSCSAATATAAPRPGPATSARTGCRRRSAPGTATAGCGRTCSAGSRSGHDPGQLLPRRQRREGAGSRDRQRRRPRACPQRRCVEPPAAAAPHGRAPPPGRCRPRPSDRPPAPAPPEPPPPRRRRPATPRRRPASTPPGPRRSARSASGVHAAGKGKRFLAIDDEHIHLREERRISEIDGRRVHRHRHARRACRRHRRPRGRDAEVPLQQAEIARPAAGQRRSYRGRRRAPRPPPAW